MRNTDYKGGEIVNLAIKTIGVIGCLLFVAKAALEFRQGDGWFYFGLMIFWAVMGIWEAW